MYVYIKDEQVFLMMKVIGGQSIATDNTCKTYKELKSFFDNAPGELDNVINLYERLGADASEQENITNVLTQLKNYREILNEVKNKQSTAAMAADDYQVVIPKGLYEMVLDSRTNPDNFLKSTKPIFAVAHKRIGDGAEDKDSILGQELRDGFHAIKAADIIITVPTVEGYKKEVAALVEGKKLVLPMTDTEADTETLGKLKGVWNDLGYPQASWDETAKGAIEQRMEYMKKHAPDDYYKASMLLGSLDGVSQVIFQGEASNNFKTFAAEICGENDTKTDKLSVLTQFFLATTNIYLHDKHEYKTNLGETFDNNQNMSEKLAATVKTALGSAGDVENAIIKFLETNKLIVAVSPADIVAIKKEFSTNYSIIRISDHMDEFFVKPKNKDNPWFEYGGSMCVEFSEFAKGVSPDESSEFINGKIKEFKSVPRKDDNSITYAGDPSLQLINKLEDAGYPAHKLLDIMLENNITDPELFDKVISKIDPNEIDVNKTWFFVVKNNQMQLLEFLTTNNIACPIDAKIDGLQILNFAIEKGRTDIAKALIENGADVNAKDKDGLTPLNMATYFSHLDIAEFLIKKGANLNAKDKYGFTPIHLAIVQDNLELVKLFLGRDPNIINTADNYANINPLHIAVSFGHIDIAEFLINKDADVNAKDKSGSTPMHMAIIQVDKKIAKGLIKALINIEKIDLDAKDNKGYTPLHTAIERLNLGAAKAFITKGANINAKDNKGYTPLHTAIEHRNLRSVNALIEKNADVNAKDNQGYTPLHMAVFQSETVILQALITKGANINANDNQGYTPLHIAAFQSETETLQALIKVEKIDLNAKNKQGNTPLHMAAIGGHIDIVKVLLEKGAEVGIKNSQDYTALNIAHQGGNQEIIKLIETAMDSKDTPENKGMKL